MYNNLSQINCGIENTLAEIMTSLPQNSILQIGITAGANTFTNTLPNTGAGILICRKGNNVKRGSVECIEFAGTPGIYYNRFFNGELTGWKKTSDEDDINDLLSSVDRKVSQFFGTYNSLADFWTAFSSLSTYNAFFRIKDSGGWSPSLGGWFRGWVTTQNMLGNGKYAVAGSIFLTDGTKYWIGTIGGGGTDTSDLTVKWDENMTLNSYNTLSNTLYNDTITLNNGITLMYGNLNVYKQGRFCSFSMCVNVTGDPDNEVLVGTLPSGYRPTTQYITNVHINGYSRCDGYAMIYAGGDIHIKTSTTEEAHYWISVTYPIRA